MPVDWSKYPPDWKAIVERVRERSRNRCECQGECGVDHGGRCAELHGCLSTQNANVRVILTTAHLDHDTTHNDLSNLRHMCQRCHLRYDQDLHRQNAIRTRIRRREEAGQGRLFGGDD